MPLTPAAADYVRKLPAVPSAGPERLVFFQDYLEHEDPLLAQDAYDEFGRAPYSELHELKPQMKHDKIVKWVADPEVSPSRRRLYLTMLGVCGTKADVPLLEAMIASDFDAMKPALVGQVGTGMLMGGPAGMPVWIEAVQQDERRKKQGLDALVACYLILRGPDGLDLIEDRFLKNPHAEYTHVYSTIMALRFHGDENTSVIPRERLLAAMRLLLKNTDFADQVILDLSRWEDWSVMDQMVEMFKNSDERGYVRQPVVSYLTVASEQEGDVGTRAKAAIEELEKIDPETVKTARSLMAFGRWRRAERRHLPVQRRPKTRLRTTPKPLRRRQCPAMRRIPSRGLRQRPKTKRRMPGRFRTRRRLAQRGRVVRMIVRRLRHLPRQMRSRRLPLHRRRRRYRPQLVCMRAHY